MCEDEEEYHKVNKLQCLQMKPHLLVFMPVLYPGWRGTKTREPKGKPLKQGKKQQQTTHMWHQARIIGNIGVELAKY